MDGRRSICCSIEARDYTSGRDFDGRGIFEKNGRCGGVVIERDRLQAYFMEELLECYAWCRLKWGLHEWIFNENTSGMYMHVVLQVTRPPPTPPPPNGRQYSSHMQTSVVTNLHGNKRKVYKEQMLQCSINFQIYCLFAS